MWGRGQQQAASVCVRPHVWVFVSESAGSWKCPLTSDHPENQRLCSEQETPSLNLTLPFGNLSTDGRNRVSFLLSAWGCSAPEWTQSELQSVCPNLWPSCFPLRCVSEAQTQIHRQSLPEVSLQLVFGANRWNEAGQLLWWEELKLFILLLSRLNSHTSSRWPQRDTPLSCRHIYRYVMKTQLTWNPAQVKQCLHLNNFLFRISVFKSFYEV